MNLNSAQISNILFALFGLFTSWGSVNVGLGTLTHPGPGFFPFWAGILLAFISLFQLMKSLPMRKNGEKGNIWINIEWINLIVFALTLFIYIFVIDLLGFLISSFLLLVILFKMPKGQKWHRAIFSSFLTVFFSYLIFGYWLDVYFPSGIFSPFK
jgi:putative tricarboxylic transport membrane protein